RSTSCARACECSRAAPAPRLGSLPWGHAAPPRLARDRNGARGRRPLGEAPAADARLGAASTLERLVHRLVPAARGRATARTAPVEFRHARGRDLQRRRAREPDLGERAPPRRAEPDPDRRPHERDRLHPRRRLHPDRQPDADGDPDRAHDPEPPPPAAELGGAQAPASETSLSLTGSRSGFASYIARSASRRSISASASATPSVLAAPMLAR